MTINLEIRIYLLIALLVIPTLFVLPTGNAVGTATSCKNQDRVAGVCLPKTRKKYPISVENNFLLACKSGQGATSAVCGCTLVYFEKTYSLNQFKELDKGANSSIESKQAVINAYASCL